MVATCEHRISNRNGVHGWSGDSGPSEAREEIGVLREPLYSKRIRRRTVVRVPRPSDARCIGLPIMRVRTQPLARGTSQLEKGSLCQESPLRAARLGLQR